MKTVFITVCNEDWMHRYVVSTLINMCPDGRYELRFMFPVKKPYEAGLHTCINEMMEKGYDYWLNMDADNPPIRNPLDLVELDKDVIGLPTPIWKWDGEPGKNPIIWNAFSWNGEKQKFHQISELQGLQRVDGIGSGCFLASRRAFENPEMRKGCFQRHYHPDGTVKMGCDLAFSRRCEKNGVEIWAHFDYPCRHFKEYDLSEIAEASHGYIAKSIHDLNAQLRLEHGRQIYVPSGDISSDIAKAHIAGQKFLKTKR